MNITSGNQYRNFAAQNEFSFGFNFINSTSSGISNIGFSGSTGGYLNLFKFNSGQILDLNNKYIWSYNPREEINISGNIGPGYINYFINDNPVCLYTPRDSGYYDNFYINTQNCDIDYDLFINGSIPDYVFEYDSSLDVTKILTGYIKNLSFPSERSFKIFSGQLFNNNFEYSLQYFDSGIISGGKSGQFLLKPVNVSITDTTQSTINLLFNTNFGIINQLITFNIYPTPVYFTDFITGYTGYIGLEEDFTLEKLYNFELQSIYPKNRYVTFTLLNVSGHTGQKIYSALDASGYVSGLISGFIYGFDYMTGVLYGSGLAISQQDFYGKFPTGVMTTNVRIEQYATGEIIYNYNLPIYGGYGTGTTPVGTIIPASGLFTGDFSGFCYGQNNIYNYKDILLSGYYDGQYINTRSGNQLVYTQAAFTGLASVNYENFLWSCNYVTGTGYFSGESFSGYSDKIIGITGTGYFYIDNANNGIKYVSGSVFSEQSNAEVLIPLIGQNNGLFINSGNIYAYEANTLSTYLIFRNGTDIQNSITGDSYVYFTGGKPYCGFIFSFDGYNAKDKGDIRYFSFDLDKENALYRPDSPVRLYLSINDSPTGLYSSVPLSSLTTDLKTALIYDSKTCFFKCSAPTHSYNKNNTYKHAKLIIQGKPKFEHQSTGNTNLITGIGIKNFQLYRSIPVAKLSGLNTLTYSINTNNMTGYSNPSGNILNNKSYSGTVISSQDSTSYPAWNAFNTNKTLYPYAEVIENYDGETTIGYTLNNPLDKIFSKFTVDFQDTGSFTNYFGVEISLDGVNYYECYNKISGIKVSETGFFQVATGVQSFRLNFTPLAECVYAPYSDACYKKVIKEYPNCCNTLWDNNCELAYRGCTGAFPPGIEPPIYTIPEFYTLNQILDAGFASNSPMSVLINGSGNPEIWGGSTEEFNNISGLIVKNKPLNATGLKNIYMPFPGSTISGVIFGIGCTGNLIMWGATGTGNIGIIPDNLGPIKKIVHNSYGGALILKENNRITGIGLKNTYPGWTGMVDVLKNTDVIDIDAGYSHYLALLSDRTVCAWGVNVETGEYTNHISKMPSIKTIYSGFNNPSYTDYLAVSGLEYINGIAAGYEFSLLISGYTYALNGWGSGFYDIENSVYPYLGISRPDLTNVKAISAGWVNGMAIYSNNGNLTGWGVNTEISNSGNYGQNDFGLWMSPTTGIYSISAGKYNCLALRKTGENYEILRWGDGSGISQDVAATGFYTIKPITTGYLSGNKYCL